MHARSPVARQVAERAEAPAPAEAAEEEVDFEADEPEEVRRHSRCQCTCTVWKPWEVSGKTLSAHSWSAAALLFKVLCRGCCCCALYCCRPSVAVLHGMMLPWCHTERMLTGNLMTVNVLPAPFAAIQAAFKHHQRECASCKGSSCFQL